MASESARPFVSGRTVSLSGAGEKRQERHTLLYIDRFSRCNPIGENGRKRERSSCSNRYMSLIAPALGVYDRWSSCRGEARSQ